MREILFRGKDAVTREWIYGCYVDNRDRGRCPPIIVPKNGNPHIYVVPETVGQFTGLTDKNGKKIFEGDVVLVEKFRKGVIRCLEKEALFAVDFSSHLLRLCDTTSDYIEIIGNIHDQKEGEMKKLHRYNPDLLWCKCTLNPMEGKKMEFNMEEVLTVVTSDKAVIGKMGWFDDTLIGLKKKVTNSQPQRLIRVQSDVTCSAVFVGESGFAWGLFYPCKGPMTRFLDKEEMNANDCSEFVRWN